MTFSGSRLGAASYPGRVYVLLFPDATDYLAQTVYDYTQSRAGCPDFTNPNFLNMGSANMNMSLPLSYESFEFPHNVTAHVVFGEYDRLFLVPYSSRWGVFIVFCGSRWMGSVQMNGKIEFRNPFGQLDADLYPVMMTQAAIMVPLQIIALLAYLVVLGRNRRRLHFLQFMLPAVLVIGLMASLTRSIFLKSANTSTAPTALTSISALVIQSLFIALFYATHRWVLLMIAFGPRMVRYGCGGSQNVFMALLSMAYGVIVGAQTYFDIAKDPINTLGPFAISVLLTGANMIYYMWITYQLGHANSFSATSRHKFKVDFYDRFTTLVHVCAVLIFVFGVPYVFRIDSMGGRLWSIWWMLDFYLQLVYVGSLCYVMWLLRPNNRTNIALWYAINDQDSDNAEVKRPESESHIQVLPLEIELRNRRGASFVAPSKLNNLRNATKDTHSSDRDSIELESSARESLLSLAPGDVPPRRPRAHKSTSRRRREEELVESARRTSLLSSSESSPGH